ncbi:TPA: DNA phosphorothioation-dependent restriction protein DptF [Yersinia enterocolitica]|nr:DNA phosphorothioation-dependent restriction protein DptF [Yersinia enterocolitica]
MEDNRTCLISELQRFKQSSKEAVENIEEFNGFKQYMHVERPFEKELVSILREIKENNFPNLVMVCGSVGDGKSHLISFLKSKYQDLFANVNIHNDATESFSPTQTSMDTLRIELDTFSDRKIGELGGKDMVIAINLGTLSNFLNSTYSTEFTKLKTFVEEQKIIEDEQSSYEVDQASPFRFINLSDYHLYELTPNGVESSLQKNLLEKVVGESQENPFYQAFKSSCHTCEVREKCPILKNYMLLQKPSVQNAIIEQISELIIKYKVIISARTYLDFLYRVLVHERYDQLKSYDKIVKEIKQQTDLEYINALLPNLFYEYGKRSELFSNLENIQPDTIRLSEVDDLILNFFNTNDLQSIFLKYLKEEVLLDLNIDKVLENFNPQKKDLRLGLFHTLLRFNRFLSLETSIEIKDNAYSQYLSFLYHWNRNNVMGIRDLYKDVINSIYNWNGKADKGKINRFIGRNQLKYTISQGLMVEPNITVGQKRNEEKLDRFLNYINLEFRVDNSTTIHTIKIDYNLFELITKIKFGYRPNNFDKNNFISFVDFVEKIIKDGCNKNVMEFKNKVGKEIKSYSLTYDQVFGVYEFKENHS